MCKRRRDKTLRNYDNSICFCTKCGNRNDIVRRKNGQKREYGHLKKAWCPVCKEFVNHFEVKEYDLYDFDYEEFMEKVRNNEFERLPKITPNEEIFKKVE